MNKVFCQRMQSLIPHAFDGELDETIRAIVLRHAADCPQCTEALEFQSQMRDSIERGPMSTPSSPYFDGALAEVHYQISARGVRSGMGSRRRIALRAAAGSLVCVVAALWLVSLHSVMDGMGWAGGGLQMELAAAGSAPEEARGDASITARGAAAVALVCLLPIAGGLIFLGARRLETHRAAAARTRRWRYLPIEQEAGRAAPSEAEGVRATESLRPFESASAAPPGQCAEVVPLLAEEEADETDAALLIDVNRRGAKREKKEQLRQSQQR